MNKIKRGIYEHKDLYLTRMGKDWVAVASLEEANWVNHGNYPRYRFRFIHNTLRDLRLFIDREVACSA